MRNKLQVHLSNIDKITVVDTGGGEGGGANKVTSYATNLNVNIARDIKSIFRY